MVPVLSAEEATRILSFLGYGRLSAPIWFIGLEEGLSEQDSLDQAHNLKARGTWEEVMDLDRAHLLLRERGEPIRVSVRPPRTPTWRWMAKICRALAGHSDWDNPGAAEDYVRQRLGRADPKVGETFLTEISPIPAKNIAANKRWLTIYREAAANCDRLIWQRSLRLRILLDQHQPEFIFCYGAERRAANSEFKKLLTERSWRRVAIKSELAEIEGRTAALMPFFGNGRISTVECAAVISEILANAE